MRSFYLILMRAAAILDCTLMDTEVAPNFQADNLTFRAFWVDLTSEFDRSATHFEFGKHLPAFASKLFPSLGSFTRWI